MRAEFLSRKKTKPIKRNKPESYCIAVAGQEVDLTARVRERYLTKSLRYLTWLVSKLTTELCTLPFQDARIPTTIRALNYILLHPSSNDYRQITQAVEKQPETLGKYTAMFLLQAHEEPQTADATSKLSGGASKR